MKWKDWKVTKNRKQNVFNVIGNKKNEIKN